MAAAEGDAAARVLAIVRSAPGFVRGLAVGRAVAQQLRLADWCIGAGALRTLVWDRLHGRVAADVPAAPGDVDYAFLDPHDLTPQRDAEVQATLAAHAPDLPWEATNQCAVHCWFEAVFGHAVPALATLDQAVATWPETATAVAVRLDAEDALHLIAPLGEPSLADLLGGVVRRNPRRVSVQTYRERCASKRYAERWPGVRVVPE